MNSRYAETMDARVVIAVEKYGVGGRRRLQRRYSFICNLDRIGNGPPHVVEVQVGCGNVRRTADGDNSNVIVLEFVRRLYGTSF